MTPAPSTASELSSRAAAMAADAVARGGLIERLKPFPSSLIHENPSGGGSYVKHSVVVQRLLDLFGSYDFEVAQVIRGRVEAKPANPKAGSARGKAGSPQLEDAVVGAVCRLTVECDGRRTVIEDVGDCEDPHNWPHDGARLKDATSDAIKRCAARLGVGLHLWSQAESYLYEKLTKESAA
jgi:hypothetical protein